MAVRRESVRLELEDHYSTGMVKAAAATALLDKQLGSLSKAAVQSNGPTRSASREIDGLTRSSSRADKSINQLTGRIQLIAEAIAVLGPATIPIGAVAIPAVTGLASALGFATLGAGTMVLAFQGVGDALKAVNKAALEPTADNLAAAREEMARLSPEARGFVRELRSMIPELKTLRDVAASGLFPGLTEGLDGLEEALPRVERIISAIATEMGDIAGETGQSLGSDRWAPFLDFLATEGPAALDTLATAVGNTAHALAGLWMSTTPLNQDFSDWLVESTADLDRWANGLGQTQGFADFLAYVEETGPQVADTLGALGNAAVQIVEAAAPLGGPVLQGLESVADVLSSIADSDLGTPIFAGLAALSLYNRALKVTGVNTEGAWGNRAKTSVLGMRGALLQVTTAQDRARLSSAQLAAAEAKRNAAVRGGLATLGRGAALTGALAIASTGAADKIGLTNTATLALAGSMAGPWGAALGAGVGFLLDAKAGSDGFAASLRDINRAIDDGNLDSLRSQLAAANKELDDAQNHDGLGDALSDIFNGDWRSKATFIPVVGGWISSLGGVETAADRAQAKIDRINTGTTLARANAQADLLAGGFKATAAGVDTATMSVDQFSASLARANNALSAYGAATNYAASLDNFTKSLKENGKTLDVNTEKGRNNRDALQAIANDALELAKTMTGSQRTTFLDNARADFIKAQVAAGKSRAAARAFADQVGLLNQVRGVPKIDLNKVAAERKLATFSVALDGFVRKKRTIHVGLDVDKPPGKFDIMGNLGTGADGATVPKTGKPYADRHLWLVADGERIVSNRYGQVDRHAGLLDAIENDRTAADGNSGRTGGSRPSLNNFVRGDDLAKTFSALLQQWNKAESSRPSLASYIRNDLDMEKVPRTLKQWERALERSTKAIDKERSERDELVSQKAELAGSVAGRFQSELFGDKPTNWAYMSEADRQSYLTRNPISLAKGDAADADRFEGLLKSLAGKGLDGKAFEYFAQNADLATAQAYVNQPSQIGAFEQAFNLRNKETGSLGAYAAGVRFDPELKKATAELQVANAYHKQIVKELAEVKKAVEKAGKDTKNGVNGGNSHRAGQLRVS